MRELFEEQLQLLNQELTEMGCLCEEIISMASQALVSYDEALGQKVSKVGAKIDEEERTIEAICMRLLLRQQPVARDLRVISSALKMITDMERIGDHASDISEMAILMADRPYIKKLEHIQEMAKEASVMLVNSIEAFVNKDVKQAHEVIIKDDVVDNLFETIKNELISMIHKDPQVGDQAMDLLMVAKYLERIGDHACNIADWVIFSITGSHEA